MKEKCMEKVSVIIPVYNGEIYLRECMESVLRQSFGEFEVILVDDGSTDSSGRICDEYAGRNGKVKVIHKENEGLICARADGIRAAQGGLITFVDADDWVEADFLDVLVRSMAENQADIVMTRCIRESAHGSEILRNSIPDGIYERQGLSENIFPRMLHHEGFYRFGILPYLWNKIYRREILQSCYSHIDTRIYDGEDVAVVFPYLLKSEKAVILSEAKYHYRIHDKAMPAGKKSDYYENCCHLYLYLAGEFNRSEYSGALMPQLDAYMRMMVWQKNQKSYIEAEKYLFPFGKVPPDSAVVLYGAGVVGQTYRHQIEKINYCNITAWVDKNYRQRELQRMGVRGMEALEDIEYQFIVIAIENRQTAEAVIADLTGRGIDREKIII